MLDLSVIKKRAADRLAAQVFDARPVANSANRLTGKTSTAGRISQLATLAITDSPPANPDRWCWPKSEAMNMAEIDRFRCRVVSFIRRGIGEAQGELVADLLVIRDRHHDGLHLCLECSRLSGFADQAWRCANHRAAGVSRDLAADLVSMPQRCQGFAERVAR